MVLELKGQYSSAGSQLTIAARPVAFPVDSVTFGARLHRLLLFPVVNFVWAVAPGAALDFAARGCDHSYIAGCDTRGWTI